MPIHLNRTIGSGVERAAHGHQRSSRQGFSLLDLLVVIAIIAILAAMLLPVHWKGLPTFNKLSTSGNASGWETHEIARMSSGNTIQNPGNADSPLPDGWWNLGLLWDNKDNANPKAFYNLAGAGVIGKNMKYDYYVNKPYLWPSYNT